MTMAILATGFVGLIQAVTIGAEHLDFARKLQIANQIAVGEIEKLRGGTWETLTSLPDTAVIAISQTGAISGNTGSFALASRTADAADDNTALSRLAGGFSCSLTRTFLRPSGASAATATYLKVVYTVTWSSNTGRPVSHQVEAYFGKNGLHLSFQQA